MKGGDPGRDGSYTTRIQQDVSDEEVDQSSQYLVLVNRYLRVRRGCQ